MDSNHDNVVPQKIVWDSSTCTTFVELSLEEVTSENIHGSLFNKVGMINLGNNLKNLTGRVYFKLQPKKHWDFMKREWKFYDS